VIIKQLKEINDGKNGQKGKLDKKKKKKKTYWTKKLIIFLKKWANCVQKVGLILGPIPKISPKNQLPNRIQT
jgi:hypothetical protein